MSVQLWRTDPALRTRTGEATEILVRGRHDPCLLPRFVPMGEAMIALVLIDHLLRNRVGRLG